MAHFTPITLDKTRNLHFDGNALCEFEEYCQAKGLDPEAKVNIRVVRAYLYYGLKHEDKDLTLEKVGSFLTPQNLLPIGEVLATALTNPTSASQA